MRKRLPLGRTLMYTALAGLAVFVLMVTFVLQLGGGATSAVSLVSLHSLTSSPEAYKDQIVTTDGTLAYSDELKTFELAGDGNYPLRIRSYGHPGELPPLKGLKVRVTGRFGLDPSSGVYMDADVIRPSTQ